MAGASRGGNALLVSSPEEAAISEGFSAIAAPVPLHASNSVYRWIDWSEKAIEFRSRILRSFMDVHRMDLSQNEA
jgi:hypothetical protein